ncbi:MAG: hypothetical protein KGZ92_08760 [Firmicutes bacterium]|nr:hypothetical protein [Dethiobacter sp.]MBS3889360.1 hypothetical protein [Bacillota bacterium]MBS4055310.1 hypothetical protein [Thermaerobacter sp.]
MTNRLTKVIHSSHGLAALVAGLSLLCQSPRELGLLLPRYLVQMQKPGQHVILRCGKRDIVCFRSGKHPEIVDMLFNTARDIWPLHNFSTHYLREGRCAKWRALLYTYLRQDWLIAGELRRDGHDAPWR